MKWFCFLSLLIATSVSANGSGYFSVQKISKGHDFSFPILKSGKESDKKINQLLQLTELRALADIKYKHLFDTVSIDDGSIYGGKHAISYKIHSNNERIFSVGFDNSSCGATCHYWVTYHNFNSQNGDRIVLRDLFTNDGYKQFADIVSRTRVKKYRSEVMKKVEAEEQESFLTAVGWIEADDLDDFAIEPNAMLIDGENTLHKGMKFNGINMEVRFGLPVFKKFLNEYGKTVFGLRKGSTAKYRSNSLPQLFTGTVNGKSPFVAVVFNDRYDGVEGIYAYLKYRTGIYLTGQLDKHQVSLTEHILIPKPLNPHTNTSHKWEDGGTISGTFNGQQLEGTWADRSKTKTLPFTARRD